MSEVAEIRKLFQDLIAPDLKAVTSEMAALKASVTFEVAALKASVTSEVAAIKASQERQLASMEALAQPRYETILAKLDVIDTKHTSNFNQILKSLDIDKRLERIEALQASTHAA